VTNVRKLIHPLQSNTHSPFSCFIGFFLWFF